MHALWNIYSSVFLAEKEVGLLSESKSAALEQALQIRFLHYALIKSACDIPALRWTALYQLRHKNSKQEIKKDKMFRLNPLFPFKHYDSLKELNIKKKNPNFSTIPIG